jgi:hypothetical protein
VRLQDERGKPAIPQYAVIEVATIPEGAEFRLLGYLDPYGDTYFNQVQMTVFLLTGTIYARPMSRRHNGNSSAKWLSVVKVTICTSDSLATRAFERRYGLFSTVTP